MVKAKTTPMPLSKRKRKEARALVESAVAALLKIVNDEGEDPALRRAAGERIIEMARRAPGAHDLN